MARDHFSKAFHSPYFITDAYKESPGGQLEIKIENFFKKIFRRGKK